MSEPKVRALKYEVEGVGKRIKESKRRFLWVVSIGERVYNFVLDDSVVSGKSKLSINGKVFHQTELSPINRCTYNHSFVIQGCLFNLLETSQGYDMRINNNLFSHLLTREYSNAYFTKDTTPEIDFAPLPKKNQSEQKIVLSLPGMNGMKKKKGPAAQSDNWNSFTGNDDGFPNFFGQEQSVKPKVQEPLKVQKQPQIIEDIKEQINVPTPQQFNTLQNLFQTINACGTYVQKTVEGETATYQITQIPTIPAINLAEFNTMQNLFSTIAPISQQQKPVVISQPKLDDFNTMQNMFNTIKLESKPVNLPLSPTPQSTIQPFKIDLNDFSTMYQLFATNSIPISPINNSAPIIQPMEQSTKPEESDFNTMQNMFATQNYAQQTIKPVQKKPTASSNGDFSKINLNDFNTMQNLFATNVIPYGEQVLTATTKQNQWMQFETGKQSAKEQKTVEKKENQFWQF